MEIRTIPHSEQRYETCGDYWVDENGVQQVRISELNDWRYEVLIAVHEIVELSLARQRNIDEDEITNFDVNFEQAKGKGECFGEAGDHVHAPYRKEHFFATNIERLFAAELGVDWFEYERYVDALGSKK
ncbi:MAG: hypothetical protein JO138_10630 [Acidobacteriaceae bacterium]|nr:hypothetical protein [Acidobacteriaceae bacterium]